MSNLNQEGTQEAREALNEVVRMQGDILTAEGNSDQQKRAGFEQYKLAAENGDDGIAEVADKTGTYRISKKGERI